MEIGALTLSTPNDIPKCIVSVQGKGVDEEHMIAAYCD